MSILCIALRITSIQQYAILYDQWMFVKKKAEGV